MSAGLKTWGVFIWGLFLMAGSAFAQSSLPACQGSDESRWTNCFGTLTYTNGNKYIGEYKGGKPNGQGTFTFTSGNKHVGGYLDGKPNGQGTVIFANGNKYVGEIKDGKFNGQGIKYQADGSISASGNWSGNKLESSLDLDRNRFPFNPLTQTAPAQPSTPERVQLAAVAQSQLPPCPSGPSSNWKNCFGGTYLAIGYKYVGEWMDGKPNGEGAYTFPDGNGYVGEFRDGMFHGQGIEYFSSGTLRKSGRWSNGNLVQSYSLDTSRFPFNSQFSASALNPSPNSPLVKAERDRLAADTEAERKRSQELEKRLAEGIKERERLAAEAEDGRRERQQLLDRLAATNAQGSPINPPPTWSAPRNAHALVIGNAAYPGSNRLDNTINDANAISQKLRSMGFTVTTVTDTSRQRLVQAMSQFKRSAANAELSLFFYAGHGVQIFGTNYILPTDVDQNDVAQATIQGVSLNSVVENFLPGKTKLVFLDACRDNPLQRSGDRSVSKGLAPISVAQGTLISYATKDGQTASDGAGAKNSPFTQALLQHLDDPADIAVVLRKVREKVMQTTKGKQQPWEYGSLTGGELVLAKIKGGR
jgi:hypothetical protein